MKYSSSDKFRDRGEGDLSKPRKNLSTLRLPVNSHVHQKAVRASAPVTGSRFSPMRTIYLLFPPRAKVEQKVVAVEVSGSHMCVILEC